MKPGLAGCSPKSAKTESSTNTDGASSETVKHGPKGIESCDLVVFVGGRLGIRGVRKLARARELERVALRRNGQ